MEHCINSTWGCSSLTNLWLIHDNTARVYVSCEDKFHTLRRRVVRRVYTIFLRARLKKMRDSCAFVIQCYKFPLYYIVEWNKELLGLKERQVDNGKFLWWKKLSCYTHVCRVASLIDWIASSSNRFAWFELLMKQRGRKISLTQGIETRVSLSK